jgi:hypothetical protein
MASTRKQGGFLIQSNFGTQGNFEVVVPNMAGGFGHFWRDNDAKGVWHGPDHHPGALISGTSLIQSTFGTTGNLELVVCEGKNLVHYWCMGGPPWKWYGPTLIGTGVQGNPSLIQSSFGNTGNFEVVVPHVGEGFVHYSRDNDEGGMWTKVAHVGSIPISGVALIQSKYGTKGNLEVVARTGNKLVHYWRTDKTSWTWAGPFTIATGVQGTPSLIQSSYGTTGNFEVVVPRASGGLAHYWRVDNWPWTWSAPTVFGSGNINSVSLIQSNYGTQGEFEVVAYQGGALEHYRRYNDVKGLPWKKVGPIP